MDHAVAVNKLIDHRASFIHRCASSYIAVKQSSGRHYSMHPTKMKRRSSSCPMRFVFNTTKVQSFGIGMSAIHLCECSHTFISHVCRESTILRLLIFTVEKLFASQPSFKSILWRRSMQCDCFSQVSSGHVALLNWIDIVKKYSSSYKSQICVQSMSASWSNMNSLAMTPTFQTSAE
jgi:hypothetical protein